MVQRLDVFNIDQYQKRPIRGIYIDAHNELAKISPADYTGVTLGPKNIHIPKREVYDAIVAAQAEAKKLGISKQFLPLGADTHTVDLSLLRLGLMVSYRIDLILNLKNPKVELNAFRALIEKYNTYHFCLGRVPFHNNQLFAAMVQLANNYKHARISSVFYRKRDMHPRVYVGVTTNDFVFNVRSTTSIDIEDLNTSPEVPATKAKVSRIEIDL